MDKKKYYINLGTREISINHEGNNDNFAVYATREELFTLREIFNEIYGADVRSFFRAHVPAQPYHQDQSNDDYDGGIQSAFQMIYDLGDDVTRNHIAEMGVLEDLS